MLASVNIILQWFVLTGKVRGKSKCEFQLGMNEWNECIVI